MVTFNLTEEDNDDEFNEGSFRSNSIKLTDTVLYIYFLCRF